MRSHNIDFSRQQNFLVYPTRFVTRMVLYQLLMTTAFILFLLIGDFMVYNQTKELCSFFPHEVNVGRIPSFILSMGKKY